MKGRETVNESRPAQTAEELETVGAMRLRVRALDADREAMRAFALRVAEASMGRDTLAVTELCPHCSLKRQGEYGYSGTRYENNVVDQVRRQGL